MELELQIRYHKGKYVYGCLSVFFSVTTMKGTIFEIVVECHPALLFHIFSIIISIIIIKRGPPCKENRSALQGWGQRFTPCRSENHSHNTNLQI